MKNFYLICAKCGSDELIFKRYPTRDGDGEMEDMFVSCSDCAALTCVEEHNERIFNRMSKAIAEELRGVLDEESSS